jgi:hypothetical protein
MYPKAPNIPGKIDFERFENAAGQVLSMPQEEVLS